MPPTAFQPRHTTPFKSTLSSSVQPEHRHTPFLDNDPTTLKLSSLDPSEWAYHAEGGLNLLLRYAPTKRTAAKAEHTSKWHGKLLRLRKAPRSSSSSSSTSTTAAATTDTDQQDSRFRDHVIVPLLGCGDTTLLPQSWTVSVQDARDRATLEALAAKVEIHRPRERRNKDGIYTEASRAWIVEDLCAAASDEDADVLTVEIKPKWGYLPSRSALDSIHSPNLDLKTRYSRFRMHKVARHPSPSFMTQEQFQRFYDPLDLYSCDEARMRKAVDALVDDWRESEGTTNSLRLYWRGEVVRPAQTTELDAIKAYLSDLASSSRSSSSDNLSANLAHHLLPALSTARLHPTSSNTVSILSRLAHLQSVLDARDVEGLSSDWQRLTSSALGSILSEEHSHLLVPPTLDEIVQAVNDADIKAEGATSPQTIQQLRRNTVRFLVAATLKDCSIMVRIFRRRSDDVSNDDVETEREEETESARVEVKLVDLDLKPLEKLAKFQATDEEVVVEFRAWLSSLEQVPGRK